MIRRTRTKFALLALPIVLIGTLPSFLRAEETTIEKAGVALGVSAGNVIFLPAKAISTSMGVLFGALSFVLTGGESEILVLVWRDRSVGAYVITQESARNAIRRRPNLSETEHPPAM